MNELIKLLLVEDNEEDAALLVRGLRNAGFEVDFQRVQTFEEMRDALSSKDWDVVISDFVLPTFNAPKALETLKQSGKDLPFIVVSGAIGEETAVEIMRSGAKDYFTKDKLNRLPEALRREIRDAHGRMESKKAENALHESERQLRLLFERSNDAIFVVDKHTGRYLDVNKAAEKLTGRTINELKTLTMYDVSPVGVKERLAEVASASDPLNFGEVAFIQPDGIIHIAELNVLSVNDDMVFGIAHEVTEQRKAENALIRRAQELEALYQTSLEINTQTDLLPLLQTIVKQAANLLNARMGGLYLLRQDDETLELVVSHNLPGNFIGTIIRLGEGLSGKIAQTGRTMMIEDYSAWEHLAPVYKGAPFRRVLGAPLRVKGGVIGVINITDDEKTGLYSPEEIRLVSLFADQAAIAVENTRLLDTVQRELNERRQAEEALRESEEHYRVIVTNTPLVSFVINLEGIFTLSEGKGLSALGLKPGQVVGQSVFDLYRESPDIIEDVRFALAGETRHRDIKVGDAAFEIHYIPIFDMQGNVNHMIGVAIDITERKKAEENLRSTQVFLDQVIKAIPMGIAVYNLKTGQIEFDNALNIYFSGMSMAKFNALPSEERWNMVHPDDRYLHAKFIEQLTSLADGEVREIEFRYSGVNGDWRWLRYRYFVFERDKQGTIKKLLSLNEDVTSRKQAEQALQRQLKELTILHNIARAGILVNSIDEFVELVTKEVGISFYPDNFGVLFMDEAQKVIRRHPSYHGITEKVPDVFSLDSCIAGLVASSGRPLRIGNVKEEPVYLEATAGIQSELCVPIKIGEHVIGVINAESKQPEFFTEDDERLLLTITGQMAIAIERMRLFESERNRRQEAETLRQATAALSTSLNLDQVLESILTSLKQVVPYDSASVFLLEGDHLRITITRGTGNTDELLKQIFPANDPLFLEVQRTRQPIIITDMRSDTRFRKWGKTPFVRGWMSIPLITRGEVIGYVTLDNHEPDAYSPEAASLAQAFAHQAAAAIENARLFSGMEGSLLELNLAYESTIEGWSKAMDLRDKETEGHTLRVTEITMKLAEVMGLKPEELIHIRRGALLHDIGKMGVPDRILLKPDNLTDEELFIMRRHPQYAYDMLSSISYLRPALDIPYYHHERWDGSGYPNGLKGEEIPLAARLFAVVDVWDALTSDRPYRPAWTVKEALSYITQLSGKYFDPNITSKFLKMMKSGRLKIVETG